MMALSLSEPNIAFTMLRSVVPGLFPPPYSAVVCTCIRQLIAAFARWHYCTRGMRRGFRPAVFRASRT